MSSVTLHANYHVKTFSLHITPAVLFCLRGFDVKEVLHVCGRLTCAAAELTRVDWGLPLDVVLILDFKPNS